MKKGSAKILAARFTSSLADSAIFLARLPPRAGLRVNPTLDPGLIGLGSSGDNAVMIARTPTPERLPPHE